MFETLGAPELLIIFALVVLLFGAGKVSRLGKELGTSIKEFRVAMREDPPAGGSAEVSSQPLLSSTTSETAGSVASESAAGSRPPSLF